MSGRPGRHLPTAPSPPAAAPAHPAAGMATVRDVLLRARDQLGSATEARWVVEAALERDAAATALPPGPPSCQGGGGRPRSSRPRAAVALARTGAAMSPRAVQEVDDMVARRLSGEPLQYVVGEWSFRTLELAVDPRVLIPRPETEVVCGRALDELARAAADAPGGVPVVVVDLGTGSGALALSLAVEGPARLGGRPLEVWATDDSPGALEVAAANLSAVRAGHPEAAPVRLAAGSWFEALPGELAGRVTLVVSNPPYVSEAEWERLDPVVRDHEPRTALVAGPVGTEAIDRILEEAPRWLGPWGVAVLELAPAQAEDAALRALVSGFDGVLMRPDLAERARVLVARRWGG